jgi:cbb3-type cytochrome oxidase maturation protein
MDILYLLIPMSALLVLGILLVFAWALHSGQFDDLSRQGQRILDADEAFDRAQGPQAGAGQESGPMNTSLATRTGGPDGH